MAVYSWSSAHNLIIGSPGSGKTNALLNLMKEQNGIDKIYLYAKDLNEPKHELLIKKHENAGIKHLNDQSEFTECSNTMDDVYPILMNTTPTEK